MKRNINITCWVWLLLEDKQSMRALAPTLSIRVTATVEDWVESMQRARRAATRSCSLLAECWKHDHMALTTSVWLARSFWTLTLSVAAKFSMILHMMWLVTRSSPMVRIMSTKASEGIDQPSGALPPSRHSWFEMKCISSPSAGSRACLNLMSLRLLEIMSIKPWSVYIWSERKIIRIGILEAINIDVRLLFLEKVQVKWVFF